MTMSRRNFFAAASGAISMLIAPKTLKAMPQVERIALSRRHTLGCQAIASTYAVSTWRLRAYRAAEVLATGGKAPLGDVQRLIVDLIPSGLLLPMVQFVHRGGKRKLKAMSPEGAINLQGLVDLAILTEQGASAIREKRHGIYMR